METRLKVSQFYLKAETYNEMVLQLNCATVNRNSQSWNLIFWLHWEVRLMADREGRESKWNVYEEKVSAVQLNEPIVMTQLKLLLLERVKRIFNEPTEGWVIRLKSLETAGVEDLFNFSNFNQAPRLFALHLGIGL